MLGGLAALLAKLRVTDAKVAPKKRTAAARVPVPWVTPPGAPGVPVLLAAGVPGVAGVTRLCWRDAVGSASNVYTRSGLEQKLAQFQLDAMMPKWPFRSCDASLTGARA